MRALPFACLLVLRCARPPTHDCCNTTTQLISTRGHDIGSLDEPGAEDIAAPWHTPSPSSLSGSPPSPLRAPHVPPPRALVLAAPAAHTALPLWILASLPRQPRQPGEGMACTGFAATHSHTRRLRPRTRQTGSRPEPNQWRQLQPPSYLRHARRCLPSNRMGSADDAQERGEGVRNRQSTSGHRHGGDVVRVRNTMKALPDSDCPHPSNPSFRSQLTRWSHMLSAHMLTWRGATNAERPTRRLSRRLRLDDRLLARRLPRLQQGLCVRARPDADARFCCWFCWVPMLLLHLSFWLPGKRSPPSRRVSRSRLGHFHPLADHRKRARQTALRPACGECSRRHGKSQPAKPLEIWTPTKKKKRRYISDYHWSTPAALILPTWRPTDLDQCHKETSRNQIAPPVPDAASIQSVHVGRKAECGLSTRPSPRCRT